MTPSSGPLQRIAVIGRAGSGKTTSALRLGETFNLPVIHLDQLFWTSDWEPVPGHRFDSAHDDVVAGDRWVIDGSYLSTPTLRERLRRADVVVITEAPFLRCLLRVVRRSFRDRGRRRLDRPKGADEALSLTFLVWIARWSWQHRNLETEVAELAPDAKLILLRCQADLEAFVARLASQR